MDEVTVLKAVSDGTRMKILKLLLRQNYCVRALARQLDISEAAVSQHLKVLREAELLVPEKRGYFVHYDVRRNALLELASTIAGLASIERTKCTPASGGCCHSEQKQCRTNEDSPGVEELSRATDDTRNGCCHGHSQSN